LGSLPEKGEKKKKKKTAPVTPQKTLPEGRPPEKAKKKKKKKKKTCPSVGRGPETRRTGPPRPILPRNVGRTVLPQNVFERTGRFCRGTSSDERTDYLT
jgi:hypothetical protein